VQTNAFIGKFIDQTFHVPVRMRARTPLDIYSRPMGWRAAPFKNHWYIAGWSKTKSMKGHITVWGKIFGPQREELHCNWTTRFLL